MKKKGFKLECSCGFQSFSVAYNLKEDTVELICKNCGESIARIPSYAVEWLMTEDISDEELEDEEEADVDDID